MDGVKFLDLKAQYPLIKSEIMQKFDDIIDNSSFISGKYVREFEQKFADYIGVKYCIAVDNGTNALMLALMANKIGHGDEVIVPVNTFIATAEAVSLVGATPVFVDIDENTYTIDTALIEDKITANTRAIIPVHLYGQCADMNPIMKLADKHNLIVIEDACQAHGSSYDGKKAGSIGQCGAFSAYPGKNLGTWGEGGMVTTNDEEIANTIRLIRDHGSKKKYHHEIIGGNFRMNEFEAAVLIVKLKYLDDWNGMRRKNALLYKKTLHNKNVKVSSENALCTHIWHLFVIRVPDRDSLIDYLNKNNIGAGIHYPYPLHLTGAYAHLGYVSGDFPVAEKVQKELLSLPMYAELTEDEVLYVCEHINNFV